MKHVYVVKDYTSMEWDADSQTYIDSGRVYLNFKDAEARFDELVNDYLDSLHKALAEYNVKEENNENYRDIIFTEKYTGDFIHEFEIAELEVR